MRLLLLFALSLLLTLPFAADAETVLRRGLIGQPTLDPHRATGSWENAVLGDLFEGLVTENAKGELIPGQAAHWEISGDRRVYTFYLRTDARWSDGSPVTAEDFEFAFKHLLDPDAKAPYAALLYAIAGAREYHTGRSPDPELVGVIALDERTLLVILSHPTPYFLTLLKHWTTYPLPRAVVMAEGDQWTRPEHFRSNGAFRLAPAATPADPNTVVLVRNEQHYGQESVAIDRIVYRPIEDAATGLAQFQAGALDLYPDVPGERVEAVRAELGSAVRIAPYLGMLAYALNCSRPPFDNPALRRALALTIDREAITRDIVRTGEAPAYSLVPPGTLDYRPAEVDFRAWPMERRRAEAQRLVAQAGYGDDRPLAFTLSFNAGDTQRRTAERLAQDWRQSLEAEVTLKSRPVRDHYQALQERQFDAGRTGWVGDFNGAESFLFLGETGAGTLNYAGYSNPDYDLLIEEAASRTDGASRADLLRQAETLILRDLPYLPIYAYVSRNLVARSVKGYVDNFEDIHRSRWLSLER